MELISVVCIAYNHKKYIRKCLDSIINQKTEYEFKIIVHDDASTDGTADIIREYKEKYPELIIPILQKENRYSQGISVSKEYMPYVKGKYTAVCEGDDYWCDNNKLQRQVEFLEAHPDYVACVHNTIKLDERDGSECVMYGNEDKELTLEDVGLRGGSCFHTSSLFCKTEFFMIPDAFRVNGIGDYQKAIYLALNGKIHYFKDVMSVYRFCSEGSWSLRQTSDKLIENYRAIITILRNFDEYSEHKYHDIFEKAVRNHRYLIEKVGYNYPTIKKQYKDIFLSETLRVRCSVFVRYCLKRIKKQ